MSNEELDFNLRELRKKDKVYCHLFNEEAAKIFLERGFAKKDLIFVAHTRLF